MTVTLLPALNNLMTHRYDTLHVHTRAASEAAEPDCCEVPNSID